MLYYILLYIYIIYIISSGCINHINQLKWRFNVIIPQGKGGPDFDGSGGRSPSPWVGSILKWSNVGKTMPQTTPIDDLDGSHS